MNPAALSALAATRRSSPTSRGSRRHGSVLPLMVVLLFVLFAIGGLVIDLGLAWVSQSRMISASDAAALEALRWRDQFPDTVTDPDAFVIANGGDPTNPSDVATARDLARRQQAASLASLNFADSPTPQPGDERFGAGPQFLDTPGVLGGTTLNAGETLLPGNPTVYKPRLQPNSTQNLEGGDIVAGTYNSDVTVSHQEGAVLGGDQYSRLDFAVSTPGVSPTSSSLLIRMRRSQDQAVDQVASTGPPIPFLFARGGFMQGSANANGYAPRRDGMTVRATAIANAVPAVYVGLPIDAAGVQGSCPIAFAQAFWENGLPPVDDRGNPTAVSVTLSGTILTGPNGFAGQELAPAAQMVGAVPLFGPATLPPTLQGYFPIVAVAPSGAKLVIGFGWAEVDISGGVGTVTKLARAGGSIAPRNASADLRLAWPALGPGVLSASDRAAIRTANSTLKDSLLAPVLVRSMSN